MTQVFSIVKCTFQPARQKLHFSKNDIEVVYAESDNLDYAMLKNYVSAEELERSDKFHFADDRRTYICCHAILRLMLAQRLNKSPLSLVFEKGQYRKPYLPESHVCFNIAHTRKAFTIAFSDAYIGVDLENLNRLIEPRQFMKSTFSINEELFITENLSEERERFFLLWTRKEAFLKAIGSGIVNDLKRIEVSEPHNFISPDIFAVQEKTISGEHFIYSMRIFDNFLSIATPREADLKFKVIDDTNFINMMSDLVKVGRNSANAGYLV